MGLVKEFFFLFWHVAILHLAFFLSFLGYFWAVFDKMSVIVTFFAFERQLFVVYFLHVLPSVHKHVYNFWHPFFQIYFHADPCTGEQGSLWFRFVNVVSKGVSDCLYSFIILAMQGKVGYMDPY